MTRAVGPRVLAWITATTATALLLFGLVIASDARGGLALVGDNSVATMLFGVALAVVGAIIIDRKGSHLVGWLFCVASVAWALYAVGSGYAQLLLADPSHESAVADGFVWIASWANLIGFACIPGYLLFVFPTGRLWDPRWSRGVAAVTVATASGVIGYAFAPGPMEDFPWLRNPYGIHGVAGTVAEALTGLSWPLLLLSMLWGARVLTRRMRTGTAEEQQQIKWLLLAGIGVVLLSISWMILFLFGDPTLARNASGVVLLLIPVSVGIAIVRYRLFDIDVIVNRTLVYGALTALLALLYLGAVVVFQGLLGTFTEDSDLAIAASTLAVAGAFRPLRSRTQEFIDRRFFRQRYDAAETLASFTARLRDQVDLDSLGHDLVGVIGETMQPAHASVWLRVPESAK